MPKYRALEAEAKGDVMVTRAAHVTVMSLLLAGLIISGCAKRPATTAATSAPAPAPRAAAPATAAPAPAAPAPGPSAAPAPATAAPTTRPSPKEFTESAALKDVFFEFDKYDIRPEDTKTLDANAAWLKSNASHLLLVEGHCDVRGTNEYNVARGERRAQAALNYLVAHGVPGNLMTVISYAGERPRCPE